MNSIDLLFLSFPAALAALKLTVLVLAAVWAMYSLFRSRGLLPDKRSESLSMPVRS